MSKPDGNKPGRPALDPGGHSVPVHVKMRADDYDRLQRQASQHAVTVPEWIRRKLRES